MVNINKQTEAGLRFLAIPFEDGMYWRKGAAGGPTAILEALRKLRSASMTTGHSLQFNWADIDVEDVEVRGYDRLRCLGHIEDRTSATLHDGRIPIILGGDHSITLSVVRAFAKHYGNKSFGIIHIDAHSDTFPAIDGFPYHHGAVFRNVVEESLVSPGAIYQIGLRGLVDCEWLSYPKTVGIHTFTIEDFRKNNLTISKIVEDSSIPYYLSIDIDAVDPAYAPGTGTPVPGGFTSTEMLELTRQLKPYELIGFDLVEVAPCYDPSGVTALLAAHIVAETLIHANFSMVRP